MIIHGLTHYRVVRFPVRRNPRRPVDFEKANVRGRAEIRLVLVLFRVTHIFLTVQDAAHLYAFLGLVPFCSNRPSVNVTVEFPCILFVSLHLQWRTENGFQVFGISESFRRIVKTRCVRVGRSEFSALIDENVFGNDRNCDFCSFDFLKIDRARIHGHSVFCIPEGALPEARFLLFQGFEPQPGAGHYIRENCKARQNPDCVTNGGQKIRGQFNRTKARELDRVNHNFLLRYNEIEQGRSGARGLPAPAAPVRPRVPCVPVAVTVYRCGRIPVRKGLPGKFPVRRPDVCVFLGVPVVDVGIALHGVGIDFPAKIESGVLTELHRARFEVVRKRNDRRNPALYPLALHELPDFFALLFVQVLQLNEFALFFVCNDSELSRNQNLIPEPPLRKFFDPARVEPVPGIPEIPRKLTFVFSAEIVRAVQKLRDVRAVVPYVKRKLSNRPPVSGGEPFKNIDHAAGVISPPSRFSLSSAGGSVSSVPGFFVSGFTGFGSV